MSPVAVRRVVGFILVLAVAVVLVVASRKASEKAPGGASLHTLRRHREVLRRRLAERIANDPTLSASAVAGPGLVIGIDPQFLTRSVTSAARCYLDRIELDLSERISVSKEKEVKVKLLVARVRVGSWRVDVDFPRLRGVLQAGLASIVVRDGYLDVAIPVRITEGGGTADLVFEWDANLLSKFVCGDFRHTLRAEGKVVPRNYVLTGRLVLGTEADGPVVRSELDDDHVHIAVEVAPRSYHALGEILREQSADDRCGMILDEAKVERQLREFVDRGFRVRLPSEMERTFTIPARFASEVDVLGRHLGVEIVASEPTLDTTGLWASAEVRVRTGSVPAVEPTP